MTERERFEKWWEEIGFLSGTRIATFKVWSAAISARQPEIDALSAALRMALDWIDAVPSNTQLPTMPGFDRDVVDELLAKYKTEPK